MDDPDLAELRIPVALHDCAREITTITDGACADLLDDEYAQLCRELVARLARERPSPLARGKARIWAAGAIYAVGRINFLFDPSVQPHPSADQLAEGLGVVKTTMANKAGLISQDSGSWRLRARPDARRDARAAPVRLARRSRRAGR